MLHSGLWPQCGQHEVRFCLVIRFHTEAVYLTASTFKSHMIEYQRVFKPQEEKRREKLMLYTFDQFAFILLIAKVIKEAFSLLFHCHSSIHVSPYNDSFLFYRVSQSCR